MTELVISGETLYINMCAGCHDLKQIRVGPPLDCKIQNIDAKWVYAWLHSSDELIESGDSRAVEVFNEYGMPHPVFQLTTPEIDSILAFLKVKCTENKAISITELQSKLASSK